MRLFSTLYVSFLGCAACTGTAAIDGVDALGGSSMDAGDSDGYSSGGDGDASHPFVGDQELRIFLRVADSYSDEDSLFCEGQLAVTVDEEGGLLGDGECFWVWSPTRPGFVLQAMGSVSEAGEFDGTMVATRTHDPDTREERGLTGTLVAPVNITWSGEATLVTSELT